MFWMQKRNVLNNFKRLEEAKFKTPPKYEVYTHACNMIAKHDRDWNCSWICRRMTTKERKLDIILLENSFKLTFLSQINQREIFSIKAYNLKKSSHACSIIFLIKERQNIKWSHVKEKKRTHLELEHRYLGIDSLRFGFEDTGVTF